MKNVIQLLTACFLLAVTSCDNKTADLVEQPIDTQNQDKNIYLNAKNQQITAPNMGLREDEVLAVEAFDEKTGVYTVRYFTSEDELYNFALKSNASAYKTVPSQIEKIRKIRNTAIANGDIDKEDNFSAETMELINAFNDGVQSKGAGILFDNQNCGGSTRPLTGVPQPTFWGFNDKAESARGAGLANRLWDRTFFRGSSIYLLLGTGGCITFIFSSGNFLNKTASAH